MLPELWNSQTKPQGEADSGHVSAPDCSKRPEPVPPWAPAGDGGQGSAVTHGPTAPHHLCTWRHSRCKQQRPPRLPTGERKSLLVLSPLSKFECGWERCCE